MGWSAGLKLRRALDGLTRVVAIELLTSARALDARDGGLANSCSSPAIHAARTAIREVVEGPGTDRYLAPEIEAVRKLVEAGVVVDAVDRVLEEPLA